MIEVPKLVMLPSSFDYKKYFIEKYCKNGILTFDGINVRFYANQFEHSFYESSNRKRRNKDVFFD